MIIKNEHEKRFGDVPYCGQQPKNDAEHDIDNRPKAAKKVKKFHMLKSIAVSHKLISTLKLLGVLEFHGETLGGP